MRRRNPAQVVCPKEGSHTQAPEGYIAWHIWAERKHRTHQAVVCDGCGLYKIWVRTPTTEIGPGAA